MWNTALRLMAMIASHLAGGNSVDRGDMLDAGIVDEDRRRAELGGAARDHLLDRRAGRPGRRRRGALGAQFVAFSAAISISASPKPLSITLAPSAASARAMARPMPEVDPVTSATLPRRFHENAPEVAPPLSPRAACYCNRHARSRIGQCETGRAIMRLGDEDRVAISRTIPGVAGWVLAAAVAAARSG